MDVYEHLVYIFEKIKSEQSVLLCKPTFHADHANLINSYIKYDKWYISYQKDCITISLNTLDNKQFVCFGVQQVLIILRSHDQLEILKPLYS